MISLFHLRLCRASAGVLLFALATACSTLKPTPPPSYYSLDGARSEVLTEKRAAASLSVAAPTLIVSPPHAASGFDSQRIIYIRETHKLEYFVHSEWVDTPARMLVPLIVAAIERRGTFNAVVMTPSAATGDLRLETEIMHLQHEFGSQPSRVRFTLRAYMVDNTTRKVLAWREFDETITAEGEDPYGGVVAANRAVQNVLKLLASFSSEVAGGWQPSAGEGARPGQ